MGRIMIGHAVPGARAFPWLNVIDKMWAEAVSPNKARREQARQFLQMVHLEEFEGHPSTNCPAA
jgi:ABC-type taurine transport system ATPase subunit